MFSNSILVESPAVDFLGENKMKSHKNPELSKNAGSRDVSSVRTVFPASGSSNMTRDCNPEKCLLVRRDFPPGCGNRARVNDLTQEFGPDESCDPSIKSSGTAYAFKWRKNKDRADNQGVGAKEAGSHSRVRFQTSSLSMTDNEYLRKENFLYNHGNIVNKSNRGTPIIIKEVGKNVRCSPGASPMMKDKSSKRSTPDRSGGLQVIPKLDNGRASRSFSELRNTSVILGDRHDTSRGRVIATLKLYRDICHELSREKLKAGKKNACIRRIDLYAANEVKKRTGYVHGTMKFIGHVPGVKVGDKFHYRMELAVVGLHRPPQGGIDYMGTRSNSLATSVVASWDYTDNLSKPDELVYLGQGGMSGHDRKAEDQKLTRGNLALVNSMKRNRPVRVIRKDRDHTFTYDGLYLVDRYWKPRQANGHLVFKFLMKRLPGQSEIGLKKKMKAL